MDNKQPQNDDIMSSGTGLPPSNQEIIAEDFEQDATQN